MYAWGIKYLQGIIMLNHNQSSQGHISWPNVLYCTDLDKLYSVYGKFAWLKAHSHMAVGVVDRHELHKT